MEFPNIGEHCALKDCKQLDFLFIQCSLCVKTFCKHHNLPDAHKCEKLASLNERVLKDVKKVLQECSIESCKNTELTEVVCPFCLKSFCLQHRHQIDHDCSEYKPAVNPMAEANKKVLQLADSITTKPKKKISAKNEKLAAKVQLMKLKGKAVGQNQLPYEERLYFLVTLPKTYGSKEIAIFVSHHWSVGKLIDSASELAKVSNKNNVSSEPRLLIGPKSSEEPLMPLDEKLKSLADKEQLFNGQSLFLEYFEL